MGETVSIAIDGPAAAGKSTVAKRIAKELNFVYIDTGAMYRALTYQAIKDNIDVHHEKDLVTLMMKTKIELKSEDNEQHVFINGERITKDIRAEDVSTKVSFVAQHKLIREYMVKQQQQLANNENVVMDGRDIGTHVLPKATCKFYLIASVRERAERRHLENIEKGFPSNIEKIVKQIKERDLLDTEREISPLVKAKDAIEIDTTSLSIDEVVEKMLHLIKERIA